MVEDILKDKILGYDININLEDKPNFGSRYKLNLLKAMIEQKKDCKFVLYSNQKRKVLSKIKGVLNSQDVKFLNYISPRRLLNDKKLSCFQSFGDFAVDNKKVEKFISLINFSQLMKTSSSSDNQRESHKWIESLRKFNKIICPSKTAAKTLVEYLPEKASDIKVVLPGKEILTAGPINHDQTKIELGKLGINEDYFLYVGKTEIGRNIPTMLKAYIKYWGRAKTVPAMVMVSETHGEVNKGLLKDTALLESKGKFILTGIVSDEVLKMLYSSARALIYPVSTDLYSHQIIEAMAMGVPVICSADGFGNEIDHDAARFIVPNEIDDIHSAMEAVENNAEYRTKLVEGGRKFSSHYDWNNMASEFLSMYSQ
ncbi:MAG: glycosyltransferase family 4 protein [candidate division Zixibacteria bacterium]|nr:glycosyltransferase family 4 protein [candidate division Zixibacteria bacterium]